LSKFLPRGAFAPPLGEYELLPFRFERLDEDTVVLTNAGGEFAFLSAQKLDLLVNQQLLPDDIDYIDLRSRHFVREPSDRAPLELLALKLRTRFHRLADFTNLHLFVVTLRCDHSCPYCQVSRQSEDKAAFDMTRGTADKALDIVFRSPSPGLKIEFQGGEPLLNFDLIKYIVEHAEARNESAGRVLQFVCATTLSLATREILEYCRDHKILLSSSLDGPQDLHDKNRPRIGRNSYEKFVDGLTRAREIVGWDSVSALMTTTHSSLTRVTEIIDEYISQGFSSIFLRPLSPYGFAIKTKSYAAYDAETWFNFYKDGLDYIIDLNKRGIHFVEHYSALVLTKMLTANDPGYIDLMTPSGAGVAAVVFNYDGDVYASDESRMLNEMGDPSFRIGNLHDNTYEEIFTADNLLGTLEDSFTWSIPGCEQCAFEPYCGADPVFHHAMYGDILGRKPTSEFCHRNMAVFKHLLGLLRQDPEARAIFIRWVNPC